MSLQMEVQVAVAKIRKYASSESGDTVEVIERPHGGLSVVVVDGQRSGRSAKAISNIVCRKAISLLAEGVRDGAVARATHDYLLVHRGGQVSAELTIVSVDLVTQSLVISRNARCPSLLRRENDFLWLGAPSDAIGIQRKTKPAIAEFALVPSLTLVVFTDGVWSAGRQDARIDLPSLLEQSDPEGGTSATVIADAVLDGALALDNGRPRDDATVLVVKLTPERGPSLVRHMSVTFPV